MGIGHCVFHHVYFFGINNFKARLRCPHAQQCLRRKKAKEAGCRVFIDFFLALALGFTARRI